MAPTELVAVGFGLAYILLAIRKHRACWIAGGISTAIYALVFYRAGWPMQAMLQVLYVILSAYGWYVWSSEPANPRTRRWPLRRHLVALGAIVLATAVSAPLAARYGLDAAPIADSLAFWASLFATWLLARRFAENWLWWIAIDAGLVPFFAANGLIASAALYFAYALLACAGWQSWRRGVMPA